METGPDAEISHDGLHRIDRSRRLQRVWVKPGLSLKGYTKILPVNAGVHFKRPPRKSRGEWPLNDEQMEFVRDGLREAVQKELEKQGQWEFVTERGPDVLVVRGAIIDLVVTAPSNEVGRNTSFSRSIGQATLLIELFDSESLEILARIADRRAINHGEGSWRNDPTSNRAAARQTFRDWARRLSKALDYARTVGLPDLETPDEQEPQDGEPSPGPTPEPDSGEAAK
jgi:hypothetical protein